MLTADVREQMIEQQVRAWDVLDERVLQILRKVPREQFTPDPQRFRAYADAEVPLPHDQHMLRPSVVGRLLQALELSGRDHVLEVGTGTGFITACLRTAAANVRSPARCRSTPSIFSSSWRSEAACSWWSVRRRSWKPG